MLLLGTWAAGGLVYGAATAKRPVKREWITRVEESEGVRRTTISYEPVEEEPFQAQIEVINPDGRTVGRYDSDGREVRVPRRKGASLRNRAVGGLVWAVVAVGLHSGLALTSSKYKNDIPKRNAEIEHVIRDGVTFVSSIPERLGLGTQ